MRQPGSAFFTAATCSFSSAASASPFPLAARIFATTVSTSGIVVSFAGCVGSGAGATGDPSDHAGAVVHTEAHHTRDEQEGAGQRVHGAVAARRFEERARE